MKNVTENTILEEHFERLREKLLNDFELSNSYGHTVNKGTAREIYKKFSKCSFVRKSRSW